MAVLKTPNQLRFGLALMIAVLPACTVGPDYHSPDMAIPGHWTEPLPKNGDYGGYAGNLTEWWRGFHDKRLDSLIERAMKGNLDLQAANARVTAARAQLVAAGADRWPGLKTGGGYQRARISPNSVKGFLGGALNGFSNGLSSDPFLLGPIGKPFDLFQAGFDSSWELDLFGGIKRNVEAVEANAYAIEESRRDIQVTLASEVARDYIELISLQRSLQVAHGRLENQRRLYSLSENSYGEGLAVKLDVERAKTELEAAEASIPAIEAQIRLVLHSLALLLGLQPGALERELADLGEHIPSPPNIPLGMTTDLLRRRPDIRQAERALASATALVGSAVADLFPKITITGAVGLQSQDLGNFTNLSSGFYGFGPRISLPLFQAGRLMANIDVQEARTAEALKAYEKTVLNAFREVEDALASLNGERRRMESLNAAESSARTAAQNATDIYAEGETELMTELDANRSWYVVQDQLIQSEFAWSADYISLYKALGGGWKLDSKN